MGVRKRPFLIVCSQPSILLKLAAAANNIIAILSLPVWYGLAKHREPSMTFMDLFHGGLTVLVCLALKLAVSEHFFAGAIAAYVLLDLLGGTLRDLLVSPNLEEHPGIIWVRHGGRWFLLALWQVGLVATCFGVFGRIYSEAFKPPIARTLDGVYFSFVTIFTVGFGDIHPVQPAGQVLVLAELFYLALFVTTKVPIAVNLFKAEVNPKAD